MDKSEQLAQQCLRSLNIGTVIYEPDGNIPPDFAVGGRIAVEVRRLNQNFEFDDGSRQGLEQLEIPLWNRFKSFLPLLGPSLNGECWYVGLDFRRPLEKWKTLEPLLRSQLRAFMSQPLREQTTLHVTSNLNLDLIRSSKDHGTFFLLGASSDDDSGGWVMAEIERNLRLCIAEKEKKIDLTVPITRLGGLFCLITSTTQWKIKIGPSSNRKLCQESLTASTGSCYLIPEIIGAQLRSE